MGLIATDKGGVDFPPAPIGNHVAVCVRVIDLGTQRTTWQGQERDAYKIIVSWELSNEQREFREGQGPEPFMLSKRYTMSLHKKAELRKDLESWRGRPFSEDELKGFDLVQILGASCLLNVIHNTKGDRTYANIAAISPLPKGMDKPKQINSTVNYVIQEHNQTVFDSLSENLRTTIQRSPEYQGFVLGHSEAQSGHTNQGADDDDIPF